MQKNFSAQKQKSLLFIYYEKMKELDILSIYRLNLYHILNIMIRAKTNLKLEVFLHKLKVTEQDYSKRHSKYNFKASNIPFRVTKFEISSSVLLNNKLLSLFKTKIKDRLLKLRIISNDFQY